MYPQKNKEASGVILWKKRKFAEQQNQVGNLPTVVAAHRNPFSLLKNVLSRKKKVTVVNKIVYIKQKVSAESW